MKTLIALTALFAAALPGAAQATYRYTANGVQNADTYRFTATANGALTGYFMGSTAGYDETLGVTVNGLTVASGIFVNHGTPNFAAYDFGQVRAGDRIGFFIDVLTTGDRFGTDPAGNPDGLNHVYASTFPGESAIGIPAGTFIGFEDLLNGGDFNYNDHTFVFTNLSVNAPVIGGAVPEPATWAMMVLGFGLVGLIARRRHETLPATA